MKITDLTKLWHRAETEIQPQQGISPPSIDQQISNATSEWNRAALLRARQTEYPTESEPATFSLQEKSPQLRLRKLSQEETYELNAIALSRVDKRTP